MNIANTSFELVCKSVLGVINVLIKEAIFTLGAILYMTPDQA